MSRNSFHSMVAEAEHRIDLQAVGFAFSGGSAW